MPISEISPLTNAEPGLSVLNQPISVAASATHPAAAVSKSALTASSPTTSSAPLASAPKAALTRKSGGGSGSGGGNSSTQQLITDTYTTTVSGTSYSGSVQQEPGGEYVASVPNLPGAIASGSSIEAAENALGAIINALA